MQSFALDPLPTRPLCVFTNRLQQKPKQQSFFPYLVSWHLHPQFILRCLGHDSGLRSWLLDPAFTPRNTLQVTFHRYACDQHSCFLVALSLQNGAEAAGHPSRHCAMPRMWGKAQSEPPCGQCGTCAQSWPHLGLQGRCSATSRPVLLVHSMMPVHVCLSWCVAVN